MDEDTCKIYKREIESMERLIGKLKKEQESLSDPFSGRALNDGNTIDFDATAFVSKEIEIGVKIKELEGKLDTAKKRFYFVYGGEA